MPGEEMEITTDFGHSGFGEEIDIDLDFAIGQHDEDLELADFDQAQDMQNFNADTRDELMAEGDDASYGMIDADDIEHNEVATTANDIEIDLGDPEENLWEQTASHTGTFENVDEIDYTDDKDIVNNNVDIVDEIDYTDDKDVGDNNVDNAGVENVENADHDENGAAGLDLNTDFTAEVQPNEIIAHGSPHDSFHESPRVSLDGSPKNGPAGSQELPSVVEATELGDEEGNSVAVREEHVATAAASEHSPVQETLEEQLVGLLAEGDRQSEKGHTPEPTNGQNAEDALGVQDPTEVDDYLLSIAARHTMYISYHRMDYRLFAASKDDDPNGYFLSDMSALQFKLGKFLSSLREVIEEEVSPLDELVIQIDGLGIEFSESSPSEILDGFTLGEILSLYDNLQQNDGEESSDFFLYLLVSPSCHKRLLALFDSARSGRGLSEVGVYRDTASLGDEEADDNDETFEKEADEDQASEGQTEEAHVDESHADEFKADEYQAGEDQASISPTSESESRAQSQSYDDHVSPNEDEKNGVEDTNDDNNAKSPLHTSVAEAGTDNPIESPRITEGVSDEKTGSTTNEDVEKDVEDDLIDYSDDELDLSAPQQDQDGSTSLEDSTHETRKEPLNQHSSPLNGATDAAVSDATSATVTLTGDDKDEIDYSDDEAEAFGGSNNPSINGHSNVDPSNNDHPNDNSGEVSSLQVPAEDEITWESENEDAKDEPLTAPKDTVQVSPSGKRPRSDSDLGESESGPVDVKRRRPS